MFRETSHSLWASESKGCKRLLWISQGGYLSSTQGAGWVLLSLCCKELPGQVSGFLMHLPSLKEQKKKDTKEERKTLPTLSPADRTLMVLLPLFSTCFIIYSCQSQLKSNCFEEAIFELNEVKCVRTTCVHGICTFPS